MATVKFDLGEWDLAFRKALSALTDKRSLIEKAFLVAGIRDIVNHFRDEAGPVSSWEKRTKKTNEAYARIRAGLRKAPEGISRAAFNPSNKLLQLTGNLRKSILNPQMRMKAADTLEVTSLVGYSGAHDEGSRKHNLPARSFMWLSDDAKETMRKIIIEAVGKGFD